MFVTINIHKRLQFPVVLVLPTEPLRLRLRLPKPTVRVIDGLSKGHFDVSCAFHVRLITPITT